MERKILMFFIISICSAHTLFCASYSRTEVALQKRLQERQEAAALREQVRRDQQARKEVGLFDAHTPEEKLACIARLIENYAGLIQLHVAEVAAYLEKQRDLSSVTVRSFSNFAQIDTLESVMSKFCNGDTTMVDGIVKMLPKECHELAQKNMHYELAARLISAYLLHLSGTGTETLTAKSFEKLIAELNPVEREIIGASPSEVPTLTRGGSIVSSSVLEPEDGTTSEADAPTPNSLTADVSKKKEKCIVA